jgi:hypothetical protein
MAPKSRQHQPESDRNPAEIMRPARLAALEHQHADQDQCGRSGREIE